MTQIYLVRHAATGVSEFEQNDLDELSPQGQLQTVKLAHRIQSQVPFLHRIYSSTLVRAVQTAQAIAEVTGAQLEEDPRLDEVEGVEQLKKATDNLALLTTLMQRAQKRVVSFLKDKATKHHGETIIVVTHGNIIKAILNTALEAPDEEIAKMDLGNTSITILSYDNHTDAFTLALLNDTMHLK